MLLGKRPALRSQLPSGQGPSLSLSLGWGSSKRLPVEEELCFCSTVHLGKTNHPSPSQGFRGHPCGLQDSHGLPETCLCACQKTTGLDSIPPPSHSWAAKEDPHRRPKGKALDGFQPAKMDNLRKTPHGALCPPTLSPQRPWASMANLLRRKEREGLSSVCSTVEAPLPKKEQALPAGLDAQRRAVSESGCTGAPIWSGDPSPPPTLQLVEKAAWPMAGHETEPVVRARLLHGMTGRTPANVGHFFSALE